MERKPTTIVFVLGGPGAGKGTMCAKIVQNFGFVHLSAGDLLREEMNSGSAHGEMISTMIKEGKIVPSEVTVGLLEKAIQNSDKTKFLIDGFPRNEENNSAWEKDVAPKVNLEFVLCLECPEEVLESRLLRRGEESVAAGGQRRTDDNLESIRKRFRTFQEQTRPVLEHYERIGKLRRINSNQPIEQVYAEIHELFKHHLI
jgi:UMP-CMP kinase